MNRWHERRGARRAHPFFLARIALVFAVLLGFGIYGAFSFVATVVGRGWISPATAGTLWPLLFLIVLALLFVATMRRFGRPLSDVVVAADRVGQGDMAVRVRELGPPWLRSVASAFNSMAARLEQQQRQRRDLMADVAHELRTPLAAMQGRLEALQDGVYALDAQQVGELLDDTRMLGRLVDDLRTLAHSESGTLTLQKEPTDLAALLDDAIGSFRWDAERRGSTVTLQAPADLPAIDVDPVRIREVATNLLANALQHTPPGGRVTIQASAGGTGVVIRVHNDGVIPAGEILRIFDRFYKGGQSSGSGLGLTIARHLVVAHGGTIDVESGSPQGTTFIVTLPFAAATSEAPPFTR